MEFDFEVVPNDDLPEKFQPPSRTDVPSAERLSSPMRELFEQAAVDLTPLEQAAVLDRIAGDPTKTLDGTDCSAAQCRARLAEWLEEQARRYQAAAAAVAENGP